MTKTEASTARTNLKPDHFAVRLRLSATASVTEEPGKDCRRSSFLGNAIGSPSLEKDSAEVGPMNLVVTHGAGLILR